jgi:mRNA-degrading endonuclease RelE of RelBE toxin-antitoxin system
VREIQWTETALEDADTGAGNVKRLQGIDPPEYRLRVGDSRVRFHLGGDTVQVLRVRNRRETYR